MWTRISNLEQARRNAEPDHEAILRNVVMVKPISRESRLMVVGPRAMIGSTPCMSQSTIKFGSRESQPMMERLRVSGDFIRSGFLGGEPDGSTFESSNNLIR